MKWEEPRAELLESHLGEQRAVEHARDGAIPVELAVDVGGDLVDPEVANTSHEHLNERALVPAVRRRLVSLENAGCHGTSIAFHLEPHELTVATTGAVPATMTNSPGMR
jgi:hypothetical protein